MLERLKSFRQSMRVKPTVAPNFAFDKLPTDAKLGILSHLSTSDLASFAATSRESDVFVRSFRSQLPKYDCDTITVFYDPEHHSACLRSDGENASFETVVIPADLVLRYLETLSVQRSFKFQLGNFDTVVSGDQFVANYNEHTPVTIFMTEFSLSQIKRARRFIVEFCDLLPKILKFKLTECETFRLDTLLLFFQERYYFERVRNETLSPIKRITNIFSKTKNRNLVQQLQQMRTHILLDHNCRFCSETCFLSINV